MILPFHLREVELQLSSWTRKKRKSCLQFQNNYAISLVDSIIAFDVNQTTGSFLCSACYFLLKWMSGGTTKPSLRGLSFHLSHGDTRNEGQLGDQD